MFHFDGIPEQTPNCIAIPVKLKKRDCRMCRLFVFHVCVVISTCPLPLLICDFPVSPVTCPENFL